jgi:endonuclease YncB( thermonuclease family)
MTPPTRMGFRVLGIFLLLGLLSACGTKLAVTNIHDGDTISVAGGEKIRLLQIDTPEISPLECYGREATIALEAIIASSEVNLESDKVSEDKDQFGRLLRYVKIGDINVNLRMVEIGAATPYFYKGQMGKYSRQLLTAAKVAKDKGLGLWKACPSTVLDPFQGARTDAPFEIESTIYGNPTSNNCDPNYQGCVPVFPPDLDCPDIKQLNMAPVRVIGTDVHRLDRDGDGVGCES